MHTIKSVAPLILLVALLSASSCDPAPQPSVQSQVNPTAASTSLSLPAQVQQPTETPTVSPPSNPTPQVTNSPELLPTDTPLNIATSSPTYVPTGTATPPPTAVVAVSPTTAAADPAPTAVAVPGSTPGADPHLEQGFPIKAGLVLHLDAARAMLVGNIDADPQQEIVLQLYGDQSRLSTPRTYSAIEAQIVALKADGSIARGWPVPSGYFMSQGGHGGMALGNLSNSSPGLEVASHVVKTLVEGPTRHPGSRPGPTPGTFLFDQLHITALTGSGVTLPGWPSKETDLYKTEMLVDLDGDGLDEIFTPHNSVYKADGSLLPNWSYYGPLAAGDLDGDGKPEVVGYSGSGLQVYDQTGSVKAEFSFTSPRKYVERAWQRVIGDVDGDGKAEIVTVVQDIGIFDKVVLYLLILSADGTLKLEIPFPAPYLIAPGFPLALADLDCDGAAEIISTAIDKLYAWKGDGSVMPGWPVTAEYFFPLLAAGDVDGDGWADIVSYNMQTPGDERLVAFDRNGKMLQGFPKLPPFGPGTGLPLVISDLAIADLDADNRNEVIMLDGFLDSKVASEHIWAYDLRGQGPYGPVQWGQLGGGPQRQNYWDSKKQGCAR